MYVWLRIYANEHSISDFISDMVEAGDYLQLLSSIQTSSASASKVRNALTLALLISPIFLCFTFHLNTKSFSRRLMLEIFATLTLHKSPLVLQVEAVLLAGLIRLSKGDITAYTVLADMVDKLPWDAIEAASNNNESRSMFQVQDMQPPSLPDTHAISTSNAVSTMPHFNAVMPIAGKGNMYSFLALIATLPEV
jgi:hypothetical protein